MKYKKIVFTDLDGTLANDNSKISQVNLNTLYDLGEKNICRVISTGRSLHLAKKVVSNNFPIDYLIFSSGSGIIDWKTKKLIFSKNLSNFKLEKAIKILLNKNVNFMLQKEIPNNHLFLYHKQVEDNTDFDLRRDKYKDISEKLDLLLYKKYIFSQIICILPNNIYLFNEIKNIMVNLDLSVVRATSPLDFKSIWLEVFEKDISKGFAAKFLSDYLGILQGNSISVGNDYNDIELLDWTQYSFVVNNAPDVLKRNYEVVSSNNQNGFSDSVRIFLSNL